MPAALPSATAGQPSFPGGALDPQDGDPKADGPLRAALREAEGAGLDPGSMQLFGVLPKLYIPVSGFVVTPVLGWWREPTPVGVVDPAETARVFRGPRGGSTPNPAHRATTVHPAATEVRHSWSNRPWSGASPAGIMDQSAALRWLGAALGTVRSRSRSTGAHGRGWPP